MPSCLARQYLLVSVACWFMLPIGVAQDLVPVKPLPESSAVTGAQAVYLAVEINGRDSGSVVRFTLNQGRLFARAQDLQAIGVDLAKAGLSSDGLISLDALPGLSYAYDASRQAVAIELADSLRVPFAYGQTGPGPIPEPTSGHGLLINYDAYYQYQRHGNLSLWNELRYFNAAGVLESTGASYFDDSASRYVRFDTSWTHSDPDTMRTLRFGDTISSALDWTRPVRMAGIQWSSNFELRPDLVTFPFPQFAGTAAVPSTVDLYINNVRRLSTEVPDGPFVFHDAPGITGAGTATIVTRDALGRSVTSTMPLYVDRRLLAPGLSSYSVEAGLLRHNYGRSSFDYGRDPAASATLRYGVSDYLTLEGHTEATRGLYNLGAGGLVQLGTRGVLSGAISGSSGTHTGSQAMLGYQLIQPNFTLDLQTTRTFGDYRDLGATDEYSVPDRVERATMAIPLGDRQSIAFNFVNYETRDFAPSRVGSIAYTASLSRNVSMNLSAYKDYGPRGDHGFLLSLSISLDDETYLSAYGGKQNGESSYNVSAVRTPDYDGGWGWGVQAGRTATDHWEQAQSRYRGRYGEVTAMAQQLGGQGSVALNASGAVVLMDGNLALSRRIYDGFAMVSTDGVGNVPVLHENRKIGATDGSGYYLVPDLTPYEHNRLAIDGLDLPADTKIKTSSKTVVPQARSGVLVRFPITRYQAASVTLHDEHGSPLAVGAQVFHQESGARTVVGYGGIAFIEDLKSMNHLSIKHGAQSCEVRFPYRKAAHQSVLPAIGPLICKSVWK